MKAHTPINSSQGLEYAGGSSLWLDLLSTIRASGTKTLLHLGHEREPEGRWTEPWTVSRTQEFMRTQLFSFTIPGRPRGILQLHRDELREGQFLRRHLQGRGCHHVLLVVVQGTSCLFLLCRLTEVLCLRRGHSRRVEVSETFRSHCKVYRRVFSGPAVPWQRGFKVDLLVLLCLCGQPSFLSPPEHVAAKGN